MADRFRDGKCRRHGRRAPKGNRMTASAVGASTTDNMNKLGLRWGMRVCVILALTLFARLSCAEVLVVTGANTAVSTLSKSQVSAIFQGRLLALPDGGRVATVDQPESNRLRDEFYLKVTNMSAAQARAQWAKLYFTGRGVPPREAVDSDEVKRLVNSLPDAVGYIDRSALDSSVRVLYIVQ